MWKLSAVPWILHRKTPTVETVGAGRLIGTECGAVSFTVVKPAARQAIR